MAAELLFIPPFVTVQETAARTNEEPLSLEDKKAILSDLREIDEMDENLDTIQYRLIEAALVMDCFPSPLGEKIKPLHAAYKALEHNEQVRPLLRAAIEAYFESEGLLQFRQILRKTGETATQKFDPNQWKSKFLTFMGEKVATEYDKKPLVELAILEGKIYWQIVNGNTVIYQRWIVKSSAIPEDFNFEKMNKVRMTWEQFRMFKDGGKRSGTVAIDPDRFAHYVYHLFFSHTPYPYSTAFRTGCDALWEELKTKGILNKHDRLSDGWRALTEKCITLERNTIGLRYVDIIHVLYVIATDERLADSLLPNFPSMSIYRRERSYKKWAPKGRIINEKPKQEEHCTKLWDVGTYGDLDLHRNGEIEEKLYKNRLEFDHVPSVSALMRYCSLSHPTGEIGGNETAERKWWAIAVPEDLHQQGKTHLKSSSKQEKSKDGSFLEDITTHLDNLEKRWNDFLPSLPSQDEYIKALGAFRYLYRCQVKPPLPIVRTTIIQTTEQIYTTGIIPCRFFQSQGKNKEIDNLFHNRLKRFLNRAEGSSSQEERPSNIYMARASAT